jgi:hypothetical protein
LWIINRDIKLQALTERVHEVIHHPYTPHGIIPREFYGRIQFMVELKHLEASLLARGSPERAAGGGRQEESQEQESVCMVKSQ